MARLDLPRVEFWFAILEGELKVVMDGRRALIEEDEVVRYEWRHRKVTKNAGPKHRPPDSTRR
jgi:mannose-6-phosphate isomerase-like protein (cupin superfamily)